MSYRRLLATRLLSRAAVQASSNGLKVDMSSAMDSSKTSSPSPFRQVDQGHRRERILFIRNAAEAILGKQVVYGFH